MGAATATGDGDIMMRFLPSFLAVEFMRSGTEPSDAAEMAIKRIITHYPNFSGAVIAVNKNGVYGAACYGMNNFPYSVYTRENGQFVERVDCITIITDE